MMLPPRIRAAFEMVEAEFGLEFLVLLLDRPALMRESDQLLEQRGGGQVDEKVFGARRGTQILFAQEPDLGRQPSIAPVVRGVTRTAANRAAQGRFVPLRHVTRRQARPGNASAKARTAIGRASRTSTSCDRGRPVCALGGTWTAGVPGNTVR